MVEEEVKKWVDGIQKKQYTYKVTLGGVMKKILSKDDLISVIVLAYNTEKYITRCLNSILNQTYQNLEVIVIDDGSTDKTNSLIKRKMKKDDRIILIEHENRGTYLSRLEGYKKANGKYLMYVDSDDYILKNMIEIMIQNLKEYHVDIVHCQYQVFRNEKIEIPKNILNRNVLMDMEHLEPQFFDLLYKTNHCDSICRQLIKKRGIMKNVSKIESDLTYKEDLACNLKIYKEMQSFLFIPDELYVYNENKDGITYSKDPNLLKKKMEDTIYVYYDLYQATKEFKIKDKKYYKRIASLKMIYFLTLFLSDLVCYSKIKQREFEDYIEDLFKQKKLREIIRYVNKNNQMIELKKSNFIIYNQARLWINKKIKTFYYSSKYFCGYFIKEKHKIL